ncbi:GNAT family N-acetyltransferase [Risungbinella massiliensis]|uniref:GNAT family N-acetyltransferase n=1 Tax=Risungbinella massiliensis TaxID=1329796 RepID=UPI0005CB94A1|nr:GNAT family N-acetyltransferase [Risungbinella massiliensis]
MWSYKTYDELTKEELHMILRERVQVFIVEQECPYQEIDEHDFNSYHLFFEEEGELRAYLRILPPNTRFPEASIGRVIVNKEYRGQGYAKQMMSMAIEFLEKELKVSEIKLMAQLYLQDFYASFGFDVVSDVYNEDNIPHIDMIRKCG